MVACAQGALDCADRCYRRKHRGRNLCDASPGVRLVFWLIVAATLNGEQKEATSVFPVGTSCFADRMAGADGSHSAASRIGG
jgi:hypothetical protein